MKLPHEPGPIHFVGIGGTGMSGSAEVLANLGYKVRGSAAGEAANVKRLREKGIQTSLGPEAKHVESAGVVVVASAVQGDKPELMAARAPRRPVVRRAE